MRHRPPLLVFLSFVLVVAAQLQPIPAGGYVYESADYARVAIKSVTRPLGQLWLYNASLVTPDGFHITLGTLTLVNAAEGAPSVNTTISFTGYMACSESDEGLSLAITSCSDPTDLCESGWFQEVTGASSYPFGVTLVSAKAGVLVSKIFTVEVPILLACAPGYVCGAPTSQCSTGRFNGTVTSIGYTGGLCSSPNPLVDTGTVQLCNVTTAGSCTGCSVTINQKGQITSYSSGSAAITFADVLGVPLGVRAGSTVPEPPRGQWSGGNYTANFHFSKAVAPTGGYSVVTCIVDGWTLPPGPANSSGQNYYIIPFAPVVPVDYRPTRQIGFNLVMGFDVPIPISGGTLRDTFWGFTTTGYVTIDRQDINYTPDYFVPGFIDADVNIYPMGYPAVCGEGTPCALAAQPALVQIGPFQWLRLEP